MKILILGYGNPGRGDDALGPLLVEELERRRAASVRTAHDAAAAGETPGDEPSFATPAVAAPAVDLVWSYELAAEHAYDLSQHDLVICVDAARRQAEGVRLRSVRPSRSVTFSTHTMTPASVLALARELYRAKPHVYLLTIRGYRWGLREGLSPGAEINIAAAVKTIEEIVAGAERTGSAKVCISASPADSTLQE